MSFENEKYEGVDYTVNGFARGEYDNCSFINCNFTGIDMAGTVFSECVFTNCNVSNAILKNTALKDVSFKSCKLLGLNFGVCNPFLLTISFDVCDVSFASFYKLKLKNTKFINCKLHDVDFVEADLTNALFDNSDLMGAIFENTILEKADFRAAHHFIIDPERNKLKKAKFSQHTLAGLLAKHNIIIE
jgi:fluoroquinolone resistance protein